MRPKLQAKRVRGRNALRMETMPPVFGRIKPGRGLRQCLLQEWTGDDSRRPIRRARSTRYGGASSPISQAMSNPGSNPQTGREEGWDAFRSFQPFIYHVKGPTSVGIGVGQHTDK